MSPADENLEVWLRSHNEKLAAWFAAGNRFTPQFIRESMAAMTRTYVTNAPDTALVIDDLIDRSGRQVPVRVYHPDPYSSLEICLYFHGGGHMAGSVEVYDPICRKIAAVSGRVVVAVDYRLAPEHPYPAGLEDGAAALDGCIDLLERLGLKYLRRIALTGDSAGGALGATLAHRYQHLPEPEIDRLALIYPSLDYTLSSPSTDRYGAGYLLEKERVRWYFDHYFQNDEDRREVSPLFMDVSDRFPATMVVTAGWCPLRDEGIRYVERLRQQRITAKHIDFEKMVHAFLNLEDLTAASCAACYRQLGTFLGRPVRA